MDGLLRRMESPLLPNPHCTGRRRGTGLDTFPHVLDKTGRIKTPRTPAYIETITKNNRQNEEDPPKTSGRHRGCSPRCTTHGIGLKAQNGGR